jgi:hypothetical protein
MMSDLINTFAARGDLAHVALLLWALAASAAAWFGWREFAAAARRFDDFVRELQSFNRRAERRLRLVERDDGDDTRSHHG